MDCRYPPLPLALLSAVLKQKGHDVVKLDLNKIIRDKVKAKYRLIWHIENPLINSNLIKKYIGQNSVLINGLIDEIVGNGTEAVGFSTYLSNKAFSLELARLVKSKKKGIRTIFGGPEAVLYGKQLMENQFVDYVCLGEGEAVLPELLECIKSGEKPEKMKAVLFRGMKRDPDKSGCAHIDDMNKLPHPDYDGLTDLYRSSGIKILPIQGSRGCINRCAFCNDALYSPKFRQRSAKHIFNEIVNGSEVYGARQFTFHDNLINADIKVLDELCDLLISHRIQRIAAGGFGGKRDESIAWAAQAVIRPEMTYDLLRKMKLAGCFMLEYGIESGSQELLKRINKNYDLGVAEKVLESTNKAGIKCWINIMPGLPTETKDDFNKTVNFIRRNRRNIYRTSISQIFCGIGENTLFRKNPGRYGLENDPHFIYWESNGGENNYLERMRRYFRLSGIVAKYRIGESGLQEWMKKKKWLLIGSFYKYKNQKNRSQKALRAFKNDRSRILNILDELSFEAREIV
ncbi:MAG: B12-binding domain-containing radical SAM protein [Endomicrobiales bacterium]|nr:B12-binding domain-containing radical SAM protein [Endomicrobiales bacterium]